MTVDSGVVVVDGQELVAKIEFNKDEEKLMLKFGKLYFSLKYLCIFKLTDKGQDNPHVLLSLDIQTVR